MKSKFTPIYTTFFLLFILFLFLGNSANPPNGYTGAPGDALCTNCHTPGNPLGFDGEVIIENFPNSITPNTDYSMTIRVTNPNGLAFRGGFQAVVLDESNNNAGDISVAGSNPTTQFSGGREYVEHNPAKNFPGGNEVTWDFTWTSPSGPADEVITMYAAGNIASGGNGNQQDLIVTTNVSGTMMAGSDPLEVEIVSSQNVSCNGGNDGSATANATGGTMPYSYSWSSGSNNATAPNLSAGTYTVTVTDALNETATAMVTITEPSILIASIINQTNIDCNNPEGSATATGSGGTPPYSYNWSSGGNEQTETFLNPGTYTVSVTDNNLCIDIEMVTITEDITPPIANAGQDGQLDCNTPILVLDGSGSSMGSEFTYLWTTFDGNILEGATTLTPTVDAAGTYTLTVTNQNNGCTASDDVLVTEIEDISLFITGVNVTCFGGNDGSINLTITGGQAPFNYDWSDDSLDGIEDPTGLSAGTYSVTVTDNNGCMESTSIEITEPTSITPTAVVTNISCFGICDGAIELSVSGGIPPYNFQWVGPNGYSSNEQNIVDLCSGDYTVTITDNNGCTATLTETVIEPSQISISGTVSNALCNGNCDGSIDISVTGGTPPYSYAWDNNQNIEDLNDLCAGNYTVTVTDSNGCTNSASFTVTEPSAIILSATTIDVSCNGLCDGSIDLTVSGGTSPFNYEWNTNPIQTTQDIDSLCSGSYTVTVSDGNGCTELFSVTIAQPSTLNLQLSSTNETVPGANDGTATASVTGGTAPYTYLWDDPAAQTTATAVNLAPGTYCVIVTDDNGCTETGCIVVNPGDCDLTATVNSIDVSCNGGNDGSAEAIATGGTQPYSYNWSSGGTEAIEDSLSVGTYSVTITDANNCEVILNVTIDGPPALDLELTSTDETTNGAMDGTATANVTGGTPSYTYLWDDPNNSTTAMIENLSAGNYCVTVTDANGCTVTGCVTVNPGGCDLEGDITIQDVLCNGGSDGSATVTATGGTPPYTYDWSSGGNETTEDSLSAGQYMVTIFDSNGCCIIINFEITEPTQIQTTTSTTPVTCNGDCDGNVLLTVTGGTLPYTFEWNNGSTQCDVPDACSGTYSVTVTDSNGCTSTNEATVTEPPPLELEMSSTDETSPGTMDGTATGLVSGGTCCYTETWNTSPPLNGQTISNLSPGLYCVTITDDHGCTISDCTQVNTEGCDMSLQISTNNSTCPDSCSGMIDLTVIGGEAPITYDWSSGSIGNIEDPTMLCPGTYSVTVTDANDCSFTISTSIEVLPEMVLSFESSGYSCNSECEGMIDLTVAGGEEPYTYLWSNGETTEDIDSLCFATYQVTVTDNNGCTKVGVPEIDTPTGLSAIADIIEPSCFDSCDGSIDLTVIGGIPPFSFLWSTGDTSEDLSSLCDGGYAVTITDNGSCSFVSSITLNEPAELLLNIEEADASCFEECDGSANLLITGGTPPYTFIGPTDMLCAGTYTITVVDVNGCETMQSFAINEPDEIEISVDEIGHEMNDQSDGFINVTVDGGIPDYLYNWKLDGSTVSSDEDPTGLSTGTYTLEVTDDNGCVVSSEEIVIDNIVGVVNHNLKDVIEVFPNPTQGLLQIKFDLNENQIVEIEVFDFTGKKILEHVERHVLNQRLPLDLSPFSEGVYTIKINIGDTFMIEQFVKHD